MTGDDHGNGGTAGASTSTRRSARPAARSPTGSACAAPPTSTRTRRLTDSQAAAYEADGFEVALHVTTDCADCRRPQSLETLLHDQLAEFAADYPEPRRRRRPTAPTASPGATGRRSRRSSSQHGIRLDTNYYYWPAELGPGPPGHVHRLGDADALRRPRRLDDRRLPGGDPDDRRVGAVLPVHDRRAARQGARRRGLLRRLHRQHAHRQRLARRARTRSSPRRRRAACRSSPRARC